MTSPVDVLVAIPAHDEQDVIEGCLDSVATAVARAQLRGLVGQALLGVTAHRCSDETAGRAARALARCHRASGRVWQDQTAETVGEVRDRTINSLDDLPSSRSRERWVFNTDADSVVPPDWISTCLLLARASGAVAVAGLVELVEWQATPQARRDYHHIVAAGMHPTGHTHVYGANLAIRMDAYRAVGGFPHVEHGEDRAIVEQLREHGHRVLAPRRPVVRTSGRMPGRAAHGLGTLLQTLVGQRPAPQADGLVVESS